MYFTKRFVCLLFRSSTHTLHYLAENHQCSPNPCLNDGICFRSAVSSTRFYCQCPDFFVGTHCENASTSGKTGIPHCLHGDVDLSTQTYACFVVHVH